jgi:aminoglycoside phosphotransferase (APT) family kinase protein
MEWERAIPETRRDSVRAALQAAFGTAAVGAMLPVRGGVSGALILRFAARERGYVLRLEPERIALRDRERHIACMGAAAAAGAAPPVLHADPATGISIMSFVAGRPLTDHPGGSLGLARALGTLIARVQAAAPFPMVGDYPEVIAGLLTDLDRSGLFAPGALDPHAAGLARIRAQLPPPASLVSSHNDPNPRNLLFDGDRLWLVDWELGWSNDPLVDLAIITIDLAQTEELEDALLEAALGRAPDAALRARLGVIRLLVRLFYGCIVLGSLTDAPRRARLDAFTPDGFRAAVAEGRVSSGTSETAYEFGKMSLAAFIDGLASPALNEALERVKQG